MELTFVGEMINRIGIPVTVCAVAIWIAIRSYLIWEKKISVQLDKQDKDIENIKHCAERTVEVLILMDKKQDKNCGACHDFHEELRHKILNSSGA